jgi:cold shock CspA family protein
MRFIGRVQWFEDESGFLRSIGGKRFSFEDARPGTPFHEGDIVTFSDEGQGPLGPLAAEVDQV